MENQDYLIQGSKIIFSIKPERTIVQSLLKFFMYFFGLIAIISTIISIKYFSEAKEIIAGYIIVNLCLVYLFYYVAKSTEKIGIDVLEHGYRKAYGSGFKYYIFLLKNIAYLNPSRLKGRQSTGYNFLDKNRDFIGFIQFAFFTSNQVTTLIEYIKKHNSSLITED